MGIIHYIIRKNIGHTGEGPSLHGNMKADDSHNLAEEQQTNLLLLLLVPVVVG